MGSSQSQEMNNMKKCHYYQDNFILQFDQSICFYTVRCKEHKCQELLDDNRCYYYTHLCRGSVNTKLQLCEWHQNVDQKCSKCDFQFNEFTLKYSTQFDGKNICRQCYIQLAKDITKQVPYI